MKTSDDKIVLDPTNISTILSIPEGKSHADDWLDDMVYLLHTIKDDDLDMLISAYDKGYEVFRKRNGG